MELQIGSVVDPYVVEGLIAEGGTAAVYLVRHQDVGSLHALKVLHVRNPGFRERLLQEGRLQASLQHPNIVPVTGVVQVGRSPALVMDYIAGPDLADLLGQVSLSGV